ncbi:assimilatory sulfite reductase (NADPH) flavoprotein subunit [Gayadomonas joobiniege]|uniref:assimilatory sulfite reductase (NADPH) flavoprotein subunit n=1 Tax=Gayadomonas joobiniege TaxID=1234606 RepID=UPI00037A8CAA|nr:assimilatory sulfite reductase (NADPH) flavoprotein subunit [Gayadomonas joobiniege]
MSSQNTQVFSPITEEQLTQLNKITASMSANQLSWVSGYLFGLSQSGQAQPATANVTASAPAAAHKLTILYGSQTGNAKGVAEQAEAAAKAAGLDVRCISMGDYKNKELKSETHVLITSCTQGEGDPPDDAIDFHEFLVSKKAPKLNNTKYSVLSLGDSSYEFFCQTGKDFDERLAKLGATAIEPRVDCDVEYEADAAAWIERAVTAMSKDMQSGQAAQVSVSAAATPTAVESAYNKKNPFPATLETNQKITGRDSIKDIRHFEISLADSGLTYQPGDSLGVWFKNDAAIVAELIELLSMDANASIKVEEHTLTLTEALTEYFELTLSHPGFVAKYAELTNNKTLIELAADRQALREYIEPRQLIDIVREHPAELAAEQFVSCLRRLTPRLYSIASSQAEVDEEVHLTVALVKYDAFGQEHQGGASGYLAERIEEGDEVKVFIEHSHFRLPEDNSPVIMVGPGTGVAPFRAFIQEIDANDRENDTWLFFGNPTFTEDFLYQVEWQDYLKRNVLNRIDLAFSRDQKEKIYVQHRLLEQAADIWQWLEKGAYFYVCGDATYMAKDVHEALVTIIEQQGGKSREEAEAYVSDMRKNKRYQRDVY